MNQTLFPGDRIHTVTIHRDKPVHVEQTTIRKRMTRTTYWAVAIFAKTTQPPIVRIDGQELFFHGHLPPTEARIMVLVHRPWINHLKALFA